MNEVWTWILNFTGVNNGDNSFGTHMYNFWSGFGGGLIQFSLLGAVVAIYRHNAERAKTFEALLKKPLEKFEAMSGEKPKEPRP